MPAPELVEEPHERQRLCVRAGRATGAAALHVRPVHVPLDVGDVVVGEQTVELAEHVVERTGVGEVEHQLVAAEHRFVAGRGERPLGVRPVHVAVGVHHLRLDPDAELHAQPGDVVDQRCEPRGIHVGRHPPVAEPRAIVPARPEPAVVEHEPFDPDRRRGGRELAQPVEVVIEVGGLPRVEQHRPRPRGMRRQRADVTMELLRRGRQTIRGVHADDRGRAIRLAGLEREFARMQQLAELDAPSPVGQVVGDHGVIAAPREVQAPHLALPLAESRLAREHERGALVRRAAEPVLDEPGAHGPRTALGVQLAGPATVEGEQLGGVGRHRDTHGEPVEQVAIRRSVDDRARDLERDAEPDLADQLELGGLVDSTHATPRARATAVRCQVSLEGLDLDESEARRPRTALAAMAEQAGSAVVATAVLGHERQRSHRVERPAGDRPVQRRGQRGEQLLFGVVVEHRAGRRERCTPVDDRGHPGTDVDDHVGGGTGRAGAERGREPDQAHDRMLSTNLFSLCY